MDRTDVVNLLRSHRRTDETFRAFAARVGVADSYLADVLRNRRNPGKRILNWLKVKMEPPTYRRAR
jgi:transcriptional regulator with XRE-family HTH domain